MKMEYITFRRFGPKEYWEKDKEFFLIKLKELITELTKNEELYNDYFKRSLISCPKDIHFCLKYRYFLMNVLGNYQSELTKDNFLQYIRDFFILEKDICFYENYIDYKEFKNIRDEVIEIYPKLKETHGGNRFLEKYFWRFIEQNTDYNYEIIENILDNYYNKKKKNNINDEEKIKLKES